MNAMDVVKEAARRSGTPTTRIGLALGHAESYVATTVNRGSTPRADTIAKMLSVCEYSLCAVPSDNIPDDALVIEAPPLSENSGVLAAKRRREKLLRELEKLDEEIMLG